MTGGTRTGVADPRAHVVPKVILVALILLISISWLVAPRAKLLVIVYGDSLTVQSEADARSLHKGDGERVVFRARGGTAMCDWTGRAGFDVLALHPSRVVLAFTGNTASCAAAAFR